MSADPKSISQTAMLYDIQFILSCHSVWLDFLLCTGIMLSLKVEQCVNLKFLEKLKKTQTECFEMLTGMIACLVLVCLSGTKDSIRDSRM